MNEIIVLDFFYEKVYIFWGGGRVCLELFDFLKKKVYNFLSFKCDKNVKKREVGGSLDEKVGRAGGRCRQPVLQCTAFSHKL